MIQGGLIRRLAASFGEKNLLLMGAILLGVAFYFVPSSPTITLLLIPLSIASIVRGISQPSLLSLVSKLAPANLRGTVMGIFQSSASLARIIGPVIAGLLYIKYIPLPYYFAAGILGLVFLVALTLKSRSPR